MPEISRFFGIVIAMFYNDHDPPHFHAVYGGKKGRFRIEPAGLLEGSLPPRVVGMIAEWTVLHQKELLENWELARKQEALKRIEPLE